MNKANKAKHTTTTSYLRMIRTVGLLLLFVFVARVGLVSVYGFAGVPKNNASRLHAEASEQENDDKKEENKYADKQFKCFAPNVIGQLVTAPVMAKGQIYALLSARSITTHYLKVLTPPPNLS